MTHDHPEDFQPAKRLIAAIAANTAFLVFEVVFGIVAGSLALLGDAGHNFSDSSLAHPVRNATLSGSGLVLCYPLGYMKCENADIQSARQNV